MPYRAYSREQDWLLPPSLGELIPAEHVVRFVAEFAESLELAEMGLVVEPAVAGAPAYQPRLLLTLWLYGFMVGVRSSRKLERACGENLTFMWLSGMQRPDHSTLARFYRQNRRVMRQLFKQTVRLAIGVGLVEFALQALDGVRLPSAARDGWLTGDQLQQLMQQVEAEIAAMELDEQCEERAAGQTGARPRLQLAAQERQARLAQALAELRRQEQEPNTRQDAGARSATDPEAGLMKAARGFVVGYNAQAVVDSQAQIVVAADVTACASDAGQLLPMLAESRAMTGQDPVVAAADSGYHCMAAIAQSQERGIDVHVPPVSKHQAGKGAPYRKAQFTYDAHSDSYTCPEGQVLPFLTQLNATHGKAMPIRIYQGRNCQGCPAYRKGGCTTAKHGRTIHRYATDADHDAYLAKLHSERGRQIRAQRFATVEPVFATIKQRLGMLRFLRRGQANAQAEWRLTCAAHNLLKLWRYWWRPSLLPAGCTT